LEDICKSNTCRVSGKSLKFSILEKGEGISVVIEIFRGTKMQINFIEFSAAAIFG